MTSKFSCSSNRFISCLKQTFGWWSNELYIYHMAVAKGPNPLLLPPFQEFGWGGGVGVWLKTFLGWFLTNCTIINFSNSSNHWNANTISCSLVLELAPLTDSPRRHHMAFFLCDCNGGKNNIKSTVYAIHMLKISGYAQFSALSEIKIS